MKEKVQIPATLFYQMALYIMDHEDISDSRYQMIMAGIDRKMEAMHRHELYTIYKSANTFEEKEAARQKYLHTAGITSSFRW